VINQTIDDDTATGIFNRYVTDMAAHLPVIALPPDTRASEVRRSRPLLYLAILDIASAGFCDLDSQRKLRKLLIQVYAHCMLRSAEYTIELLQALILSATWYRPIEPVQPGEQLDIYQLSHTAANMAIIMGLGKRLGARTSGGPMAIHTRQLRGPESDFQAVSLATRRVWLGCFFICAKQVPS
jgi:hypothetical protein